MKGKTMTDLTEKWRKGELPVGSYYASYLGEPRVWLYRDKQNQTYDLEYEIYEVLAKVPSYEEYEQLENWNRFTIDYHALREAKEIAEYEKFELLEKVKQLKELLKESREEIASVEWDSVANDRNQLKLLTKIDEVLK